MDAMQDLSDYKVPGYKALEEQVGKYFSDKERFVPIEERQDTGVLSADIISSISHGNDG